MVARKPPAVSVIEALCASPWAITEEYLAIMLDIAGREHEVTLEALEGYRARRVADAEGRFSVRNNVGVITVQGPMFRYADFFSSISGAATYEGLAIDITRARDDHTIRSILLAIDSPGGEVNGVQELAAMVRAIDQQSKPVVAYVSGTGASAAYLLASAARRIIAAPNAILGSIGVRMAVRDTSARDAKAGVRTFEFVSSQSPNKVADPETDAGRARLQKTVDDLAAVFIQQVADHRGMTADQVISNFSQGGVEIGQRAVDVDMADSLGSFEETLVDLARGSSVIAFPRTSKGPVPMAKTPEEIATEAAKAQVDAVAAATAAATKAATDRMRAILALDSAKGREDMARTFALDTELPVDKVDALLKAAPKAADPAPAAVVQPANQPRRSADAKDGLLHAEPVAATGGGDALPDAKRLDALYNKFAGRAA